MRRIKPYKGWILFLFFFLIAGWFSRQAGNSQGAVSFFMETMVTGRQLNEMLAGEQSLANTKLPGMAAVSLPEPGLVQNPLTKKEVTAGGYEVWGHMGQALRLPLAAGSFGFFNQNDGLCIISSGLARELFKSDDVIGLTVLYQSREWSIQGIINLDRLVILIPGEEKSSYQRLNFQYDAGESEGEGLGEAMLMRHNIQPFAYVVDYGFFISFLQLLKMINIWFISFLISRAFYCSLEKQYLQIPAAFLLSVFLLLLAGRGFTFSARMIPGMWSDFDFWQERLKEIKMLLIKIEETGFSINDRDFFWQIKGAAIAYSFAFFWLLMKSKAIVKFFNNYFRQKNEILINIVRKLQRKLRYL